jgi:hypothetical protein
MHQTGAFWRYSPWIMARASRAFSLFSEGCGGIGAYVGLIGHSSCGLALALELSRKDCNTRGADSNSTALKQDDYWISVGSRAKI